jgi:hypothetical protein
MRPLLFSALVLFVVVACGKSEPEPKAVANAERPACKSHDECALTTFSGCCACCEAAPRAMLKSELDRQQGQCHGAACAPCKEELECPKNERLDSFNVLCKAGTCVTEKKKPPS